MIPQNKATEDSILWRLQKPILPTAKYTTTLHVEEILEWLLQKQTLKCSFLEGQVSLSVTPYLGGLVFSLS